ncbi:hypothetical protein SERLA73DRAFT_73725 [Serpula lacrymans var. lacrymans S7.3]|uniref:WLM domain-containing protein n=1 Tax=Serpula lacrymans var. lacrymans (strain S7.3) TaxID=936435 RepID=F8PZ58_SERL3|nr:hypothetical protein SERLA73DRAFT_73725 [Serpula lacrymans var. lacrymans S7.3]
MVHVRLNERETNPNPYINFISVLPVSDTRPQEEARQLMRALAAQIKPVMKGHGFSINSFEEYEYNRVFAGRNWNNGETVELVLRGVNGLLLPTHWLISTLCHELAHIQHMNHGPAFQALWKQLRNEVRNLQVKGYYGDGYWSAGTRLVDSARVDGHGPESGDFPEYMCGGAHARARPASLRRRRPYKKAGPGNHTGAQTAKQRKPGSRITAQGAFTGDGVALANDANGEQKNVGVGFRKKAASKRAREERAHAAEKRIRQLCGSGSGSLPSKDEEQTIDLDTDTEDDGSAETDQDRRRIMAETMGGQDLDNMKSQNHNFYADFKLPSRAMDCAKVDSRSLGSCDVKFISNGSGSTDGNSAAGPSVRKQQSIIDLTTNDLTGNAKESRKHEAEEFRPSKRAKPSHTLHFFWQKMSVQILHGVTGKWLTVNFD